MSRTKESRVCILGAGCSAKCGYPLGVGLTTQLQGFYWDIPADCTRIKQSVSDTITLMKALPAMETLDQLAKWIDDDLLERNNRRRSNIADQAYLDRERLAYKQILNAKLATSALFVTREENARKSRLPSYHRLLDSVFGGDPWQEAVAKSDCHVLTFNYDRLFEVAFHDRFKSFEQQRYGTYTKEVLNSGFNNRMNDGYDNVGPVSDRFCFLKLHGSAGWWVKTVPGNRGTNECRRYWPSIPSAHDDLKKMEEQLEKNEQQNKIQPWEPLIAFPHEKQRAVQGETDFLADRYIEKIEIHAASVLAAATQVRIIGYSFAPIDSRHVVEKLLDKIPPDSAIIVQNMDVASVRSRLEGYPSMRD